jgi:hypothetical protein
LLKNARRKKLTPKIKSGREPTGQRNRAPSKRRIIKGNGQKGKSGATQKAGRGKGAKVKVKSGKIAPKLCCLRAGGF